MVYSFMNTSFFVSPMLLIVYRKLLPHHSDTAGGIAEMSLLPPPGTMAFSVLMFSVAICYILLYKGKGESGCFGRSWQHDGSHWKGVRHRLGHSYLLFPHSSFSSFTVCVDLRHIPWGVCSLDFSREPFSLVCRWRPV